MIVGILIGFFVGLTIGFAWGTDNARADQTQKHFLWFNKEIAKLKPGQVLHMEIGVDDDIDDGDWGGGEDIPLPLAGRSFSDN